MDQAYGGSQDLYVGTAQLAEGTARLFAGSRSLHAGLKTMQSGGKALKDGVRKLTDGAMQLSDGCRQFYEEGIQKLVDVMNGDLGNVVERLKACADASKAYCNFSGIADGMDGNVRFLYRTDSIEAE